MFLLALQSTIQFTNRPKLRFICVACYACDNSVKQPGAQIEWVFVVLSWRIAACPRDSERLLSLLPSQKCLGGSAGSAGTSSLGAASAAAAAFGASKGSKGFRV